LVHKIDKNINFIRSFVADDDMWISNEEAHAVNVLQGQLMIIKRDVAKAQIKLISPPPS
jgi:hypothetical protein